MDGVLIDSEPLWKIAMEQTFQEAGSTITKKDFEQTVGLRLDEVVHYWYAKKAWVGPTPKEIETKIVERMVKLISQNGTSLLGVVETLKYLKSKNLKIGLATSSYEILIQTVLSTLNIAHYFDFTHSAENESHGKPHPAVYLTVAKKLNVAPTKCLVIEDSLNGIISGKAARMTVICIPEKTHFPDPRLILADTQFDSMSEFLQGIKKEN